MIDPLVAATATQMRTSWRWQLRDSKGRWIEMGAKVKWLSKGQIFEGEVIGSPGPGYVVAQDKVGNKHRLPSNRITVTDEIAAGPDVLPARAAPSVKVPKQASKAFRGRPNLPETLQQHVDDLGDIIATGVKPENREAAIEDASEVLVGNIAERLVPAFKDNAVVRKLKALVDKANTAAIRLHVHFLTNEGHQKALEKLNLIGEELLAAHTGEMRAVGIGDITTTLGLGNPFYDPIDFLTRTGNLLKSGAKAVAMAKGLVASGQQPVRARRVRTAVA